MGKKNMATKTPLLVAIFGAFVASMDCIGVPHVAKAFHRLPPAATSCTKF
jgi:hypothetical protein